jgi:hypothetical protein
MMVHFTTKSTRSIFTRGLSWFKDLLAEMTKFIIDEKGEEVISEKHQKRF